jgi:CRP-like cAMP-binding protein
MDDKSCTPFDSTAVLANLGLSRKMIELEPGETFFVQGDPADSIFYLQQGRAKINVVSGKGKQATVAHLFPGDFFGEESLSVTAGLRVATTTAVNRSTAIKIKRGEMIRLLHEEPEFNEQFLSYLLARSLRIQADLVDQIFNSSEKRLARTLLLMAEVGKPDEPRTLIPPVTQETLAEMIGTTRSRVSFFMNRFRNRGLISYKDRIQVHVPRLRAVLLDQFAEV